jgi:hypothetical protein
VRMPRIECLKSKLVDEGGQTAHLTCTRHAQEQEKKEVVG